VRQAARALAVVLLGVLAACGGSGATGTTGTGTSGTGTSGTATAGSSTSSPATNGGAATASTGTGTAPDCGTTVRITIKGSSVTPPPGTTDVQAGCQVHLTITADRTSEVHVHVVELEKPITAGQPLQISFTPTQQGVYVVELHDPDLLLVKLAVR
jgi:hypothetical protein